MKMWKNVSKRKQQKLMKSQTDPGSTGSRSVSGFCVILLTDRPTDRSPVGSVTSRERGCDVQLCIVLLCLSCKREAEWITSVSLRSVTGTVRAARTAGSSLQVKSARSPSTPPVKVTHTAQVSSGVKGRRFVT